MSLASRYRIDNVPALLKPIYWLYTYGVGGPILLYGWVVMRTARFEIVLDPSATEPGLDARAIYCTWHEAVWPLMLFMGSRRVFDRVGVLAHPLWYMAPVYVFLRGLGLSRFFWGSSGHGGRAAAESLVKWLAEGGGSTLINPDGPDGPPHVLKPGVFEISKQTGLAIVPLCFECSWKIRVPGWDRKWIPLPFARVIVKVGAPTRGEPLGL